MDSNLSIIEEQLFPSFGVFDKEGELISQVNDLDSIIISSKIQQYQTPTPSNNKTDKKINFPYMIVDLESMRVDYKLKGRKDLQDLVLKLLDIGNKNRNEDSRRVSGGQFDIRNHKPCENE